MLDIKLIRDDPEGVKRRLRDKGADSDADIDRILELDKLRRDLIFRTEQMKSERNKLNSDVPRIKKEGGDTTALFARMKELGAEVKECDAKLGEVEKEYTDLMLGLWNLPDPDLKPGGKEN
ncbi:MAG: serine--tRNA ligase, partial [Oscillospiraceae bacterium]|nr:serine--tRNA ligase [Oscillospiraceae bacterium]